METDEGDPRLKFTIERQQQQLIRLDAAIVERKHQLAALQRELEHALIPTQRRY